MNNLKIKDVIEIPAVKPNLVVKVGEINSEQKREAHVRDYVITNSIAKELESLVKSIADSAQSGFEGLGIWVDGSFGSGKSHFSTFLGMLLTNDQGAWEKDHGFTPDGGERVKLQDVKVKEDFDRFAVVTEYVEVVMSWQDKLKERFPDKVIEKHLMSNLARRTIPRFVSEYLLAKYAQRGQDEAIRVANQLMRDYYPEMRHSQRVLFELSNEGTKRILGFFTARFDTKLNIPLVSTRLFGKEEMRILPKILDTYPILLEGGAWGVADLIYDSGVTVEGRKLPILITNFAPFQVERIDLEDYKEQRKHFSMDEWVSVLISTIGLNSDAYDMDEKLLILSRFIPLVESNTNLLELGPRGTGKTFGLRNISPYSFIISGGKTTSAQLFLNLRTMEVGLLAKKDVVVFDEIAATKFEKRDDVLGKLKDFMASGSFSRGSEEIPSECGIVMLGNTDHAVPEDEKIDEEIEEALADDTLPSFLSEPVDDESGKVGTRYLFQALPDPLWDTAFFDRLHGFIPGWRIPKIKTISFSKDLGFVADYFAEILHRLRRDDYTHLVRSKLNVYIKDEGEVTSRDEEAVVRVICGLIKLLYPHGDFTDNKLASLAQIACSLRTRIAQQQHHLEVLTSGSAREFPLKTLQCELR